MKSKNVIGFFSVLMGMLVISALILAVVSAFMLNGHMNSGFVGGGVIAAYVISSMVGGFCIGQIKGKQKFLWGALMGAGYFLALLLVGNVVYHQGPAMNFQTVSSGIICVVSGMIGGMLAPADQEKS
ncbi:MAG: TIGR04086 family membrane protein [Clostridium sp.]|nr:TIGR04086 family membrane protein [Clostridium sp.]